MKIIRKSEFKRTLWKNGLGSTDEIAIQPATANFKDEDFLWRISCAQIDQSSSFSRFAHFDRTLVILGGPGIHFFQKSGDGEELTHLETFAIHSFSGDTESRCELLGEPVQDLSVFIRRDKARSVVKMHEVSALHPWRPTGKWNFAMAIGTTLAVRQNSEKSSSSVIVGAGEVLSGDCDSDYYLEPQPKHNPTMPSGGARVLTIEIDPD